MAGNLGLLWAIGAFVLGTIFGSFLNVCIYRLAWQKSVIWPGSHCPNCLHPIRARDNIPVLSWLLLRGKCRDCGAPFSIRYMLVELLTGVLFAGLFALLVAPAMAPDQAVPGGLVLARYGYLMALVCALVVATFIDIDYREIPDSVTIPGMLIGLGCGAVEPWLHPLPVGWPCPQWLTAHPHAWGFWTGVLGWAISGGLVWLTRAIFTPIFRREAMGFGDVTLMAMVGGFLGWQAGLTTFFLAPLIALPIGLYLLIAGRDHELVFGPYLSLAAFLVLISWETRQGILWHFVQPRLDGLDFLLQWSVPWLRAC